MSSFTATLTGLIESYQRATKLSHTSLRRNARTSVEQAKNRRGEARRAEKVLLSLLPLYGCWGLRRHVIADSVDASAFINDSISNLAKKSVVHVIPVSRHKVSGSDTPDSACLM